MDIGVTMEHVESADLSAVGINCFLLQGESRGASKFSDYFTKMKSVNGKNHRYGEEPWPLQQGGNKKSPVILSALFLDTQYPDRPNKSPDVIEPNLGCLYFLLGFILFQKCSDSLVVLLGSVYCIHDVPVAIDEGFIVHLGDKIDGTVHVVAGNAL